MLLFLFEHGWGEERIHRRQLDDGFGLGLRLSGNALFVFLVHIQMLSNFRYLRTLCAACVAHKNLIRSSSGLVSEVPFRVAHKRVSVP